MDPVQKDAFLTGLAKDTAGNTLAIATASIFAIMGVVGGAVDISRSYMAQSRLQQACDAGALAARKAMTGERITAEEIATGYTYFDFNFPEGSYGVELASRTYSQPSNSSGTPQAIVNGVVVATVPTTIMKVFGQDTVDLTVRCSSKMDIANADVAMVLDVTGSMDGAMTIQAGSPGTESRLAALQRAVKAFYDSLGPGRAGGDLSKGRIRYAFVPYGTVVNVGHLLTSAQMVDTWTYQSRVARNTDPLWGWTVGSPSAPSNPDAWSGIPTNYFATGPYNTFSVVTGQDSTEYTMHDGTKRRRKATTTPTNQTINSESLCLGLNINNGLVGIQQTVEDSDDWSNWSYTDGPPPIRPATTQAVGASRTRDVKVDYGYKYRWHKNGGSTNGCWLERGSKKTSGTPDDWYVQTQTGSTSRAVTWTSYTGMNLFYEPRSINVASLKSTGGYGTLSVPALNRSGGTSVNNVKLSGSNTPITVYIGGTATAVPVTWRGCVEERQIDNTITSSTSIASVPSNAYDLDSTRLANASDDNTRWKPYLHSVVYDPNDKNLVTSADECPTPSLRLQEIGDYNKTILTTPYPNLFQATSGGPSSGYYRFSGTAWPGTGPVEERSRNIATLRNYIDRIETVGGTLHDAGFIWGLHLLSGEGMFASDNPDRFNSQIVSRNLVFMTDGEMNPGEERYVFSGFNQADGRLAPQNTTNNQMIAIQNRRLRILCEAAKSQGITVWVVVITSSSTENYDDLEACASAPGNYKTAATSNELISSFTTIAQSIGGLRISQ